MFLKKIILAPFFCIVASCATVFAETSFCLTDTAPAKKWDEGYGVGNGRLGGLVFGAFPNEQLVLNEASIFARSEIVPPTGAASAIVKAREAANQGEYLKADDIFKKDILSKKSSSGDYQSGGLVNIHFLNTPAAKSYHRELDMEHGLVSTRVELDAGRISSQLLACPSPDVVAHLIETTISTGVDVDFTLNYPDESVQIIATGKDTLVFRGQAQNGGTKFENYVRVFIDGGNFTIAGRKIEVRAAKKILIVSSTSTDYDYTDVSAPLKGDFGAPAKKIVASFRGVNDWGKLLEKTKTHFSERMNRCLVDFGNTDESVKKMTTRERVARMKKSPALRDPDLLEQLFQFGRYCVIANSRPGALPCGLQGLWNPSLKAPWRGCYFFNINCEMNYWCADPTGLGEYHNAFTDFIVRLKSRGEQFSKKIGHEGFCFAHNTDCFGDTYFSGDNPEWAASLMNGAWVCTHVVDSYRFSGDKDRLKKALPLLESNAKFVLSWFSPDPKNPKELIAGPGVSPETAFIYKDAEGIEKTAYISNGNAHDQLLGREALRDYIFVCKELGKTSGGVYRQAQEALPKIALPRIKDGRVLEWREDFKEKQPGHRHSSHIYGFFPGTEWNVIDTPEIVPAVRKSLDKRFNDQAKYGTGHSGWSEAWWINLYASLGDGNKAYSLMNRMMSRYINPNFFDMHPPFQIDGNFGFTSGVAQCLIQSRSEKNGRRIVQILPARSDEWKTGSAKGLVARGGLIVDVEWTEKTVKMELTASRPSSFTILCNGKSRNIDFNSAGESKKLHF